MVGKEEKTVRTKMGGCGKGECYVYHVVKKDDLLGHGRLFAKIVIPPGSSIGWHQHVKETEPYYILSGEGDYKDSDGFECKVHAGDICTIPVGGWHSIENNSSGDLEMVALVYNGEETEFHGFSQHQTIAE